MKVYRLFTLLFKNNQYKRFLLLAAVFTMIQCVAQLLLPRLMAEVVNQGVLGTDYSVLLRYSKQLLISCFALGASGYAAHLLSVYSAQRFATDIRNKEYESITALSVKDVEAFTAGSLITRMGDDVKSCSSLVGAFLQITLEPLLVMTGGIILVWRTQRWLGILFFGFVTVQLGLMALFVFSTAPKFQKIRKIYDGFNSGLQEVFSRLKLIKLYRTEKQEKAQFDTLNQNLFTAQFRVQRIVCVFQPLMMLIVDIAVAVILLYAHKHSGVLMGNIMETIAYAQQILLCIIISGQLFHLLAQAFPAAERITEVLDAHSSVTSGTQELTQSIRTIECRHVGFSYRTDTAAFYLGDVSFAFQQGSFYAVVGATGCGKSTLAELLVRLEDASEGEILLNGVNIKQFTLSSVREHIALVGKQEAVIQGTFFENIVFGRDNTDFNQVKKAAQVAECDFFDNLAQGMDSEIYALGHALSGGEKQRLCIARALAGNPDVLLLDDSTGSLNPAMETKILTQMRQQYPTMTIILFTQRHSSAMLAQHLIFMDEGRIQAIGTAREVEETCTAYRALIRAETKEVSTNES